MSDLVKLAKRLNRQPIVIAPDNIKIIGSLTGAYLLAQIFYWSEVQERENGDTEFGLVVDKLLGQQEIVIKDLGHLLKNTKGVSGGTILGDGKVAIILDVATML